MTLWCQNPMFMKLIKKQRWGEGVDDLEDEAESWVSETIQSDEGDPKTDASLNDSTELLEEAVAILETSKEVISVSVSSGDIYNRSDNVIKMVDTTVHVKDTNIRRVFSSRVW